MNIISLPEHLNIERSSPIQLFDYQIARNALKSKINLTKNTFSFLLEGSKELITDYESVAIENNQFLVMKSGHCLMTETISASNNTYKSILLFFTDEVLLTFLENQGIGITQASASKSFQVCDYDNFIRNFVHSLDSISRFQPHFQQQLLEIKFQEIITYLLQVKGSKFLISLLSGHDHKTRNFLKVVESNHLNKLTIQELSFLCNMSISTFKREFDRHYQVSPSKWFQEKRLDHAAFILSTQKKRPGEIYEEVGYENLSNFTQAFKKRFGTTPRQYQLNKMDA